MRRAHAWPEVGSDPGCWPGAEAKVNNEALHPSSLSRRVLLVGAAYVVVIVVMYVLGASTAAAYLTMPAWLLMASFTLVLAIAAPDTALNATVFSWTGHLLLLIAAAITNVALASVAVRLYVASRDKRTTVHVRVMGQDVLVTREVQAERLRGQVYLILEQPYDRGVEQWEFEPGARVICAPVDTPGGQVLGALRLAS